MKKNQFMKRTAVFALAGAMLAGTIPAAVFAQEVPAAYVQAAADTAQEETYIYAYAGLTWEQYWNAENVYVSGDNMTAASSEKDSHDEYDKGAFDAVSRATVNHGLHRGSFQCMATIYDGDQNVYKVSHWSADGKTLYLVDGSSVSYAKGQLTFADGKTVKMDHYEVSGIKYVPVKVKTADYADFKEKYPVVENEGTLTGGYAEGKLSAYTVTAAVTENTNGLKEAVKKEDGSYSFMARKSNGTDSGIKDTSLKKVKDTVKATVAGDKVGSYGEFLRVDLTGDGYGELGSDMQAVRWDYYADDASRTTVKASYGTKFAADNWMHKSNGIQLGLTDSLRCQLPEGTDGSGYWKLTVYALGYEDYSVDLTVKKEDLAKTDAEEVNTVSLKAAIDAAKAVKEADYTVESYAAVKTALAEAEKVYAAPQSQEEADAAVDKLNAAVRGLVKKPAKEPAATTQAPSAATTQASPAAATTQAPAATTTTQVPAQNTAVKKITAKKGSIYTIGGLRYKVTKVTAKGTGTAEVMGPVSKKAVSVTIPKSIKAGNAKLTVTSVRAKAFAKCTKLKTITIQTEKLTKVGACAFKGIVKNAKIKVPAAKAAAYKKLLKGKGQSKKVAITK